MDVTIHGKTYSVEEGEFDFLERPDLHPIKPRKDVPELDREIGFLRELGSGKTLLDFGSKYGYYVGKSLIKYYDKVYSIKRKVPNNIIPEKTVLRIERNTEFPESIIDDFAFIICDELLDLDGFIRRKFHARYVYIHNKEWAEFEKEYKSFLTDTDFNYDNLINLLIMVKDAGDGFREILEKNLPYVDHWTFLDTGSTDNTIKIIKDVMKDKRGTLYQEPFINFRDSRNRLLDLAGDKCAFNVMLDDTYVIHGNLREFLTVARGDDVATSFNIFITQPDMKYGSIRVTKPTLNKRYKYTIHEVIDDVSHQIPEHFAYIVDISSEYMHDRTIQRKEKDLDLLREEIERNPDDARNYYYMAETYLCMEDFKNAEKWYAKRALLDGYHEEKQDAIYKVAVLNHLHFKTPWKECHELYIKAHRFEPSRPEAMFMIGYHYVVDDQCDDLAYMYLKKAFQIGFPPYNMGMNLKLEMYNINIPRYLTPLCYKYQDWETGFLATERLNNSINDPVNNQWRSIMYLMAESKRHVIPEKKKFDDRKVVVFVAPGGWKEWSGETLRTRGLGGSETCVIRFAECIVKNYDEYRMIVFCKCVETTEYNGVLYIPIAEYAAFITTYQVHIAVIHRYSEYIPVTVFNNVPCHLVLHDLTRPSDIISVHSNLKNIICLGDWHAQQVKTVFPQFSDQISTLSYGIEVDEFPQLEKIPYSFIYSSFPNRGLHRLMTLWPKIVQEFPQAHLHLFCDTKHSWVRNFANDEMNDIERMIEENKDTVTNHGWVNKETLKERWAKSHVWFYPTSFEETCCLTAYEAAASRTAIVSSDVAALAESVGDRGIMIPGITEDKEWDDKALMSVKMLLRRPDITNKYTEKNYEWAKGKRYDIVVKDFVERFIATI